MKKLFTSLTALALVSAMVVPFSAFADNVPITADTPSKTGELTASRQVGLSYTITIPAAITIDSDAGAVFSLESNSADAEFAVTLTSGQYSEGGDTLTAKRSATDETPILYKLFSSNDDNDPGFGVTGSFTLSGTSATKTIYAKNVMPGNVLSQLPAGTYSEALTFTVTPPQA